MSGLTPEEQHFFESGGDTSRLQPTPGMLDAPAPAPVPANDYNALDRAGLGSQEPPQDVTPHAPTPAPAPIATPAPAVPDASEIMRAALADAQRTAAELQVRLEQATAQPKTPPVEVPDPTTDPLGNMLHQLDQVNKNVADLQSRLLEQQTQQQQINAFQQFQKQVVSMRDQFKLTAPDFDAAYQHVRNARVADLKLFGIPEADIPKHLFQEEVALSEAALRQGRNPAEVLYDMAKRHGYTGTVKATAPVLPAAKLDAVKQGNATTQPSTLPSQPNIEDITVESLKDASDADLNKLVTDPAAWAKIAGGNNIPI